MTRHGFIERSVAEVEEKLKTDAPKSWAIIVAAQNKRSSVSLCGVSAPSPRRRLNSTTTGLLHFIQALPLGKSAEEATWAAREDGYDVNLTDIEIAGRQVKYDFSDFVVLFVTFEKAIMNDTCLWPVSDGACGRSRDHGRYCGPHSTRALGSSGKRR